MHAVVALLRAHPADDDRACLRLHCIHPRVTSLCGAVTPTEALAQALHRLLVSRLRPLLHALEALRRGQEDLERVLAARARALGGRAGPLLRVAHPLLYHDACTLYWGLLSGWARADDDCAGISCVSPPGWEACRCGARHWGLTCTPPRLSGRLVRDALDECVAFCWTCTTRRPMGEDDDVTAAPAAAAAT